MDYVIVTECSRTEAVATNHTPKIIKLCSESSS